MLLNFTRKLFINPRVTNILQQFKQVKLFTTSIPKYPIYAVNFNNISDNSGARKEKKRVGRGPGSGLGKTSGRGMKGMKARTGGKVNSKLEGGQTNIMRRLPKRGFNNKGFLERFAYINISQIIYCINKGKIDPNKKITIRDIFEAGAVSKVKYGLKLLGRGGENLDKYPPLNLEISSASKQAIDIIKKHGGTVTCVYRTNLTLRHHLKPYKFYKKVLDPVPPFRKTKKLLALEEKGAM